MSKIELDDNVANNIKAVEAFNKNFQKLNAEFQDRVLYRDNPGGEPNSMNNPLDMSGNRIYNLPKPLSDHEPARLIDLTDGIPVRQFLRVEDSPVEPIGDIEARKNKLLYFDSEGNPKTKFPANDSATQLRVDLEDPEGASLVGFIQDGAGAVERTVQSKLRDTVSVKDFGAVGDGVTDDTAAVQAAIDSFPEQGVIPSPGASLYFPPGVYSCDSLIGRTGIAFVGEGSDRYGGSVIKLRTPNTALLTFTDAPQFRARNILFEGTSNTIDKGEDVSDVGILFDCTTFGDIDASFINCGFIFFRDGVIQRGRNTSFTNCIFSNGKRGVYVPSDQPSDSRGLEAYGCRFHSMGKTDASGTGAIVVEPAANFQETIIKGFDADDCTTLFRGFSGMLEIDGVVTKARDTGVIITAIGSTLAIERKTCSVSIRYHQINPGTKAASAVYSDAGTAWLFLDNCTVLGCGGHGFEINTYQASINNCTVHNPGQSVNDTYDAFYLGSSAHGVRLSGCTARQDRAGVKNNKGRYGFNLQGDDIYVSNLRSDSAFVSGLFNRNPANEIQGQEPKPTLRHEAWGTAAPVDGIWRGGDIVWNTSLSKDANGMIILGWICRLPGSPGTWEPMYFSTVSPAT